MDFLFVDENWLFTASLVVMLGLGAMELLAILLGGSLSSLVDGLVPDTADAGGGLAWLHVGRVPLLVVLVLFLALFAMAGFLLQGVADALFHTPLSSILAAPIAVLGALPATRASAALVARIMPRDESYAIGNASFIGRSALVIAGKASKGRAAEAKFQDEHGQTHYVLVEPEGGGAVLSAGDRVVLIRQLGGGRFLAAHNTITE